MKKTLLYIIIFCIPILGYSQTEKTSEVERSEWNFAITPYIWMCSLKGDLTVLRQEIPVDLEFTDEVISNLKMAGMLHAEADYKNWSIMLDASYANLDAQGQLKDLVIIDHSVYLKLKQTILEGGFGYSFVKIHEFSLDVLAGVRYFNVNIDIDFDENELLSKDFNFVEPYIGLRFQKDWNKWAIGGRFDVGGFGAGSEFSYKYNGLVAYQFTDLFGLTLGYQGYKPDYQEQFFNYKIANQGFLLGFIFRF